MNERFSTNFLNVFILFQNDTYSHHFFSRTLKIMITRIVNTYEQNNGQILNLKSNFFWNLYDISNSFLIFGNTKCLK